MLKYSRTIKTLLHSGNTITHDQFLSFSPTHRGIAFEHLAIRTLSALPDLSLHIHHHGGAGDQGVDFLGSWSISPTSVYGIVGQCKMEKKPMGPAHIRELEGTVAQYQNKNRDTSAIIGLLVSSERYTTAAEIQWRRSQWPLILITLHPIAAADTQPTANMLQARLLRFSLNPAAQTVLPEIVVSPIVDPLGKQLHVTVKRRQNE